MTTKRVGVTGHRQFSHHRDVVASIDSVLDRVLDGVAGGSHERGQGAPPVIVTSLAEGADRLVAELALRRGAAMHVILPLDVEDYVADFADEGSRAEFAALIRRAGSIEVVRAADDSREAAYEHAGRAMVHASDVVIALWDGEPSRGRGGTAEIIQYALDRDVLVEIVLVER